MPIIFGTSRRNRQRPSAGGRADDDSNNTTNDNRTNASPLPQASSPYFEVNVPSHVQPGDYFSVALQNGRMVRLRCPVDCQPGTRLRFSVPSPSPSTPVSTSVSTSVPYNSNDNGNDNGNDDNRRDSAATTTTTTTSAPTSATASVSTPSQHLESSSADDSALLISQQEQISQQLRRRTGGSERARRERSLFEVTVPDGVQPGSHFALLAAGQRILVTCPANAGPGQRIRFRVPKELLDQRGQDQRQHRKNTTASQIRMKYDKDGWTRVVRVEDSKFQWIRLDGNGNIDLTQDGQRQRRNWFHMEKSAYVRKLKFRAGNDLRIRDASLELVPASAATMSSRVLTLDGTEVANCSDLARIQREKTFEEKVQWFKHVCANKLSIHWKVGHMQLNVRRDLLLHDSMEAVMSMGRYDLRKKWRFCFIHEDAIDAGGVAREWFQLVTEQLFNPDYGLFESSKTNQMCMTINPSSALCCGPDHLLYFRFTGRVLGKALLDGQLVAGHHLVQYLYKYLLGWPIQFKDLEAMDQGYYENIKRARDYPDKKSLSLDFTTAYEELGTTHEIELVPGGASKEVTDDNFAEYAEACFRYKLMDRTKPQLKELLLGFCDVIPEPLLSIFDFQELELLMCGLPEIDLSDWMANTEYTGVFSSHTNGDKTNNHDQDNLTRAKRCCDWFWDIVSNYNHEMKAKLLQFVTATSGVPPGGFGYLKGNDDDIRKFTINIIESATGNNDDMRHHDHNDDGNSNSNNNNKKSVVPVLPYPRSHTCFNRLDLPIYDTKEQLEKMLMVAITLAPTGFQME